MNLDWLYGPKVLSDDIGDHVGHIEFNSFRLDVTDVEQIVAVLQQDFGSVEVFRTDEVPYAQDMGFPTTVIAAPLHDASDADLRNLRIVATGAAGATVTIRLSPYRAALHASPGTLGADAARQITQIICSNGRRQIQPWRYGVAVKAGVAAILAALWVWLSIETWPLVPVAALGGFTAYLAYRHLSGAIDARMRHRGYHRGSGRITVDAVTRNARRAQRWDTKRDWKVAAISVAGTLIATGVLAILNGEWKPLGR